MNFIKKIFNRASKRNETESIDTFSSNEFVDPAHYAFTHAGGSMTMTEHDTGDCAFTHAGNPMTMMSHGEPKTPHPHDIGAFMDSEFRRIRRWK